MSQLYSAADRVYGEVKELILTSRLPGGELVSEGEIAARCSVSRTPVREAFLRLETEGWMRLYPQRGALVIPIGEREARDVVEARILLESHAVATLVRNPATLRGVVECLRTNLAAHRAVTVDESAQTDTEAARPDDAEFSRPDDAEFSRLDAEFHQVIVSAADNPLLADFYIGLGERHRRMTIASMHRDTDVADRILDDHAELLDAIDLGDVDRFRDLLIRHLAGVHGLSDRWPLGAEAAPGTPRPR